jgi:putative intracellular protease/amidase
LYATPARVDPIVAGEVTAQASIATGVVLVLSGVADVDLASRHYIFADAGSDETVLAPWRVRPMALLGLAFTAVGDGLFARATP